MQSSPAQSTRAADTPATKPAAYADLKLFIAGEWVSGQGRKTQPVVSPATGETLGELPHASAEDLDRALEAAHKSWPMWRAKPPHERGKILRRAADLIRERTEQLARIATMEEGKTLTEARWEAGLAAEIFEWYADDFKAEGGPVGFCRKWGRQDLPADAAVRFIPYDWALNAQPGRALFE